jgi:hypothetical protein
MAEIYASLIIKGIKQIEQVPNRIRNDVKLILKDRGFSKFVEERERT